MVQLGTRPSENKINSMSVEWRLPIILKQFLQNIRFNSDNLVYSFGPTFTILLLVYDYYQLLSNIDHGGQLTSLLSWQKSGFRSVTSKKRKERE